MPSQPAPSRGRTDRPDTPDDRSAVHGLPAELAQIARLRERRVRPERDLTLNRQFAAEAVRLRKLKRATAGIAGAWEVAVPQVLRERTALRGLSSGVLSVAVGDDGVRFALDRWLRSGGQRRLEAVGGTPLRKVRIVIEKGIDGAEGDVEQSR